MKKCTNCSNVQVHDLTGECVSCGAGKLVEITDDEAELLGSEEFYEKEVEVVQYSASEIASVEIITLPVHPSRKVLRTIGIVKGVADSQGGLNSLLKSQLWIYESSFESAKEKIAVSALRAGGNAVIGVIPLVNSNNPGSSTLAGGGMKSVETIMLCGTAVVLE